MEKYKFLQNEAGDIEYPVGIRQLAFIRADLNGREKYGQDSGVANVGSGIRLRIPIDYKRLEKVIGRIINENDALRLILVQHGDTYKQKVIEHYPYKLDVYEAEGKTKDDRLKKAVEIASREVNTVIDWFNEPSCRFFLVKIGWNDHIFVWMAHHWIGDGSTTGLIMDKIFRYYTDPNTKFEETGTYMDFIQEEYDFLASEQGKKQLEYWKKETDGYQMLDITKAAIGERGAGYDHTFKIDRTAIDRIAAANNTTPFNVILLAYHIGLSFLLDSKDTIIGVTSANRTDKRYFRTMGYIAHPLQHRMKISDKDMLSDLLTSSKNKFSENMTYLRSSHYYDRMQFCLTYQNFVAGSKTKNMKLDKVSIPTKRSVEQFFLLVFEGEKELTLGTSGSGQVFTEAFQLSLLKLFEDVITLLDTDPSASVEDAAKKQKA